MTEEKKASDLTKGAPETMTPTERDRIDEAARKLAVEAEAPAAAPSTPEPPSETEEPSESPEG